MTKQLHIAYLFSLLAISVNTLAISPINVAAATSRQAEPPAEIANSQNPPSVAIGPYKGWLALDRWDDYAVTQQDPELALGDQSSQGFTIEGWFDLKYQMERGRNFLTSANYWFGAEYFWVLNPPHFQQDIYFAVYTSCAEHACYLTTLRSPSPPSEGWHYIAGVMDKNSGLASLYVDGSSIASASVSTLYTTTAARIQIGGDSGSVEGADEVRISDIARYTTSFQPPTAPFTCDEHTRALWHFDEVTGQSVFHDACGAVDHMLAGYNGAHAEGIPSFAVYLPLVVK